MLNETGVFFREDSPKCGNSLCGVRGLLDPRKALDGGHRCPNHWMPGLSGGKRCRGNQSKGTTLSLLTAEQPATLGDAIHPLFKGPEHVLHLM